MEGPMASFGGSSDAMCGLSLHVSSFHSPFQCNQPILQPFTSTLRMPGRYTLLAALVLALAAAWRYSPGAQPGTSSVEAYLSTLFSPVVTLFDIVIPAPDGKVLKPPSSLEKGEN